jgi:hypothetical protein
MTYIQRNEPDTETVLTWPALVTSVSAVQPTTWVLHDPKNRDRSVLLAVVDVYTRTFTPEFHSGDWWLLGLDATGEVVHSHRVQLGDTDGWMIFPDWDDASWSIRNNQTAGPAYLPAIVTARSGKTITIDNVVFIDPEDMDIIYQSLTLPLGLNMLTEVYASTISGDDHTAISLLQATADATNDGVVAIGCGIEQTTFNTQRAIRVRDAAPAYVGAANATLRRCRSYWALSDDINRSPAAIYQGLTDAGAYYSISAFIHGGLSFGVARDFGLWVGRVTADGSSYTYEITARLKVS